MMTSRAAAVLFCIAAGVGTAHAEPYAPWDNEPFWDQPSRSPAQDRYRPQEPGQLLQQGEEVRDGGPRPELAPKAPIVVAFSFAEYPAGSIVIDSGGRKLYFVLPGNRAFQYPISVGREGFAWAGTEQISRKQAWPDWHPPAEMRQRDPKLPTKMLGGLRNPLGAMALYLGNTLYRIHGTNDEKTIGRASSSGCFRMMNSAVLHLAQFAQVGTSVTVVNKLPFAPAPPPVAYTRPPAAVPPLASTRPSRVPPAAAWPDDDREDDARQLPPQAPARRAPPDESDVADVTVRPHHNVDDYDPYAIQRRPAFAARRYARDRYDDAYPRDRVDSYASERPRGRAWYDDERDDY